MKPVTAVAISGGIDSLIAAHLLKKKEHRVIGIHFLTGFETPAADSGPPAPDLEDPIHHIADQLGIQIEFLDCRAVFREKIIDYFIHAYMAGRTPNPCLVCNPLIKFGTVLAFARKLGASALATGHYARAAIGPGKKIRLLRGVDPEKDQSYFLAFLSREQIAAAYFPLGAMTKKAVRDLARAEGLTPVTREESQDICFIRDQTYSDFLAAQGISLAPGPVSDKHGNVLGEHRGLHHFTVGQRRGINCPGPSPYYVLRLDTAQNRLVVGSKDDLFSNHCNVTGINWITRVPEAPVRVFTKVRYSHKPALSTLIPVENHSARIRFDQPQSAITPGQGAVFYIEDEVMGGGWIAER